jgi:formate dehydrogenase maturation protein FdhE
MEACLEIINKRNYRENHPSPRSSSSATKRQVASETNLSSPAPSLPRQPQSVAGSLPTSDASTVSTSSIAHYREKLKAIKKKLENTQKTAAAEIEEILKQNQADKQLYEQQLLESQHDFDTTTKHLETEAALFQKQIKDRFEADRLQTNPIFKE